MRRTLFAVGLALALCSPRLEAQATRTVASKEPSFEDRPLSSWIADLNADAPQTRNAAAYAISGMGPDAKAAVPALIAALDDPAAAVRFPVCVALREIGPAAHDAIPALEKTLDDQSDDVAFMAKKALQAIRGTAADSTSP